MNFPSVFNLWMLHQSVQNGMAYVLLFPLYQWQKRPSQFFNEILDLGMHSSALGPFIPKHQYLSISSLDLRRCQRAQSSEDVKYAVPRAFILNFLTKPADLKIE